MIDFDSFLSPPPHKRLRIALGNFLLASLGHLYNNIINSIFNENDGILIGNFWMSVLPNYLLTFKSDIHKGIEQDSCL